ncbi:MAG: carbamoyltransferase HypF [Candidatus Helarchaeota archaeon]|nr:carbamoyltransferase HypF [Candidatus Helarchaeota archaeon]
MRGVLHVTGIVQGVGFRPFVYRLAQKHKLNGFVLNMGNFGVKIEVESEKETVQAFIKELQETYPRIARIDNIEIEWKDMTSKYSKFEILKSIKRPGDLIVLPPDVAICDDCLVDFNDPKMYPTRYYRYPFIACSVCGPRYTTVVDLPYDRPLTTMEKFPFCEDCAREYQDPNDRRYHAQTYACQVCGPQFSLHNNEGGIIKTEDPFLESVNVLNEGKILALMGIGGVHLVCKPEDDIVLELRRRKRKRKYKPFAVMSPSIEKIRTFATITPLEEKFLTSFRRPILLLQQNEDFYLSEEIAPGLSNIGVFLPYSGIQYLLFQKYDFPALIMTSGNISNLPMAIVRENVVKELRSLADFFLLHDRPIYQRVDDSVVRILGDKPAIIRRSRGYVPEHIDIPFDTKDYEVIAFGPELHSTGSVLKKSRCFPTQHIGDVTSLELLDFLESSVSHLMKLLRIETPNAIVCDMNPVFLSTQLAKRKAQEYGCRLYQIQHHHAHLLGLMAEYDLKPEDEIIGIALDGVGYGREGEVWGGEIFHAKYQKFDSLAQLQPQSMPGGDRCVYYPVRMLAAMLSNQLSYDELKELINKNYFEGLPHRENELKVLINQLKTKNNLFYTSGMGRVLDALSALLHVCYERTYEGEPAIRLEHYAMRGDKNALDFKIPIVIGKKIWINTSTLLLQALNYLEEGKNPQDIAASAQYALAKKITEVAIDLAKDYGIRRIGFSGGVAYNAAITLAIKNEVEAAKLNFLQHHKVPPGDAGVSIGQGIFGAINSLQNSSL